MVLEKLSEEIYEQEIQGKSKEEFEEIDLQNLIETYVTNVYGNNIQTLIECQFDMAQPIIKEIGCDQFPGFYHSIFCDPDEFIDYEKEDERYYKQKGFDTEVEYNYIDFNEYKRDVGKAFMEKYVEKINDILPSIITNNIDFKFEIVDDSIIINSPRYYNFTTDKCYCQITTNIQTLAKIKEYTLNLKGAKEYIYSRYTSRDGYISFIDNRISYWKSLPIEKYEENMLIALLDMLLILYDRNNGDPTNDNIIDSISIDTMEDISKICYASPTITYNGETYTEKEFKNKFLGDE